MGQVGKKEGKYAIMESEERRGCRQGGTGEKVITWEIHIETKIHIEKGKPVFTFILHGRSHIDLLSLQMRTIKSSPVNLSFRERSEC